LTESHACVARHAALNFVGQSAPLIAAFFAIPVLARTLGPERFGALTIGWAVLGYFSLFDFGLGRALTSHVAVASAAGDHRRVAQLAWSSLALLIPLGIIGGLAFGLVSPPLALRMLKVSPALREEILDAFLLLAAAIPIVVVTTGLRGLLEGVRRFDLVNALRIPLGLMTFLAPVVVLPFSHRLPVAVGVLLGVRVVMVGAHAWVAYFAVPALSVLGRAPASGGRVLSALGSWVSALGGRREPQELLRFGSWMTVSNLVSPLTYMADRFVIGSLISVAAVGYYTAPYEAVTRLWMIPTAATGALFPAFASGFRTDNLRVARLYRRAIGTVFLILVPIVLVIVLVARELLGLWLGPTYAANGDRVLQWLAVGVLVNSVGQVAFALVQAVGRPDIPAKLHLLEVPFYAALLWVLIPTFGVTGVAAAWSLRCMLDTAALCAAAESLLPASASVATYADTATRWRVWRRLPLRQGLARYAGGPRIRSGREQESPYRESSVLPPSDPLTPRD
jgi:O-antigen/teichoic acid export membrane protein